MRPIVLALILTACSPPATEIRRDSTEWLSAQVGTAIHDAIGSSRSDLEERWGQADSIELDTVWNRHVSDQVDTLATFTYEALEVVYYIVSADQRELLAHVEVSLPGFLSGVPFDIGSGLDHIVEALGPPSSQTTGEIRYEDEYDILVFGFRGGTVGWIKYIPYVD